MVRYLALVWNDKNPFQDRLAHALLCKVAGLRSLLHAGGFSVLCTCPQSECPDAYVLPRSRGVIIGRLFRRSDNEHLSTLSEREARLILDTQGRRLIDHYWGAYVAFTRDSLGRTNILRDPSGALRCFLIETGGVRIICSDLEDCASLGLTFSFNYAYIAAELAKCAMMGWRETGLNEAAAVLAGECVELHDGLIKRTQLWNPADIAKDRIENSAEAVKSLRREVMECARAWARCYPHILLMLSGGLDSSVLLACFQNMPRRPRMTCLNLYLPGLHSDERIFARAAAKRAGVELLEQTRPTEIDLRSLLCLPRSARPSTNNTDAIMFGQLLNTVAREHGASAVFFGQMGDQLFCQKLGAFALADHVWSHGLVGCSIQVGMDVARLGEVSIWHVLPWGASVGLLSRICGARIAKKLIAWRSKRNPFLHPQALRALDYNLRQKWIDSIGGLPIGKLLHIGDISSGQAYFLPPHSSSDVPEWIMPLYSQPVIELCLRIPLYLLVEGGWDRSIARQAFAQDLPQELVARRRKGTRLGQHREVLTKNRTLVRQLLLDGMLAQSGLLDSRALERALAGEVIRDNNQLLERCIWTEAWMRVWRGESPQNLARFQAANNALSASAAISTHRRARLLRIH